MLRLWEFQLPTRVVFGRGSLRKLGELAAPLGRRVLLVGYRDCDPMEEACRRAVQTLERSGVSVVPFLEVLPEPAVALAQQAADAARDAQVEAVIGLGGGSVIDVAKAAAAFAQSGAIADALTVDPAPASSSGLPLVALPTTAGTGAEVSDVAVFSIASQRADPGGSKATLFGPALRPRIAVIDPELAVGTPSSITAASGADALGHALEACVSRRSQPMASLLAGQAVALVCQNLARAVQTPADPEPREPLALGATLAGAAFTSAGVTGAHAIAQALTTQLGLPHGRAVALATPPLLYHNLESCAAQYAQLAAWCRLGGDSIDAQASRLVEHIVKLLRTVGLAGPVLPADRPAELLDRLVAAAAAARVPLLQNPVRLDEPALRTIFARILDGQ